MDTKLEPGMNVRFKDPRSSRHFRGTLLVLMSDGRWNISRTNSFSNFFVPPEDIEIEED